MDYDVIIVGAGPAGSAAAIPLATAGWKVLLLDSSAFPREKPCGDAITPDGVRILEEIGVLPEIDAEAYVSITRLMVTSPDGTKVEMAVEPTNSGHRFIVAEREKFDLLLLKKAMQLGAEFRQARVTEVMKDSNDVSGVMVQSGGKMTTLSAKYIVGADGSTSAVRRSVMNTRPPRHSVAIRAYLQPFHCYSNTAEFHFINEVFPGYAWIFPLGPDRANVGLGLDLEDYTKKGNHLKAALSGFLHRQDICERYSEGTKLVSSKAWSYWFTAVEPGINAFPGVLLTGDAAGFMDPLTGEGIRNALLSGKLAGETLATALQKMWSAELTSATYASKCDADIIPILNRSLALRKRFLKSPASFNRWLLLLRGMYPLTKPILNSISNNFRFL